MTFRGWTRALVMSALAFVVIAFSLAISRRALAADAKLVIVGDEKLAGAVAKGLPAPWSRADAKAFAKASKARKIPAPGKAGYVDRIGKATRDVGADAALVIRTTGTKKNRKAKVLLVTPSGRTVKDATVAADATAIQDAIASDLAQLAPTEPASATAAATPPPATAPPATPPPATAPATSPPPSAAPAATAPAAAPATAPDAVTDERFAGVSPDAAIAPPVLLDAMLALDLGWRSLKYNERVSPKLRPYHIGFVPQPAIALELYPLARSGIKVLRDIGFIGDVHTAFGLESKIGSNAERVQTTWWRADLGMRARYRFKAGKTPPTIGLSGTYGKEVFVFRHPDPTVRGQALSAWYKSVRARIDGRVPVGPIAIMAAASYLHVLEAGEIETRIRGASVAGIEAEVGVGVPLGKTFEARVLGDYRRFFYSFDPQPGDDLVAGGAIDQIIRAQIGIAVLF